MNDALLEELDAYLRSRYKRCQEALAVLDIARDDRLQLMLRAVWERDFWKEKYLKGAGQ